MWAPSSICFRDEPSRTSVGDAVPVGMYLNKYEWAGSQELGDCSIRIREAQLEFDDGTWECQVTASDFHTQDALTSLPIRLVVRG
ncbi:hypothetical protein FQR65_LT11786 [Abscondita terminalis]|nr:hypothetical protein FQR65_LT11786 [Abscondita terminalis]